MLAPVWRALAAAGALLAAVWAYGRGQRAKGVRDAENAALRNSQQRQEKGREDAADLRGADRDELVDRLRRNDGEW